MVVLSSCSGLSPCRHLSTPSPDKALPPPMPKAIVFEVGTNEWKRFDEWPPAAAQPKTLYFHPGGKLSFDAPSSGTGQYDEYRLNLLTAEDLAMHRPSRSSDLCTFLLLMEGSFKRDLSTALHIHTHYIVLLLKHGFDFRMAVIFIRRAVVTDCT